MLIRLLPIALATVCAASAAPLFHQSFSITKRNLDLKAFNNAADILVMMPESDDSNSRSIPAILRGNAVLPLYPTGEGPFGSVFVTGMSERRENGAVYVAGTVSFANGFFRAALWDVAANGSFTFKAAPNIILPEDSLAPGEQVYGSGMAVNTSGTLVGSGSSYLATLATLWAPPYNTAVRYLLSTGSGFVDIRDDGLLLANGVEFDHGGEFNRLAPAVLAAGGVPTEVPALARTPGNLYPNTARNMAGDWVTGNSQAQNGQRAFAWKRGSSSSINLPNVAEYPEAESTHAFGINASGNVLGMINGGNGGGNVIFWENRNGAHAAHLFGALLPEQPFASIRAEDAFINDNNQMVFLSQGWGSATISLYNQLNDGIVQLAYESNYVRESEGRAEVPLKLIRSPGNNGPVSVRVRTVNGTAVAPTDYIALDTTVTWAAGEAGEKSVSVTIPDDDIFQDFREFTVELVSATGAQLSGRRTFNATIMADDSQVVVRNSMASDLFYGVPVLRGQSAVTVELERVGDADGTMTVSDYRFMDLSAYAGTDYTVPTLPTLTWARGELGVKTVSIPLLKPEGFENESRMFYFAANHEVEGSGMENGLYSNVIILPANNTSSPAIREWNLNGSKTELTLEVSAPQGAVVQLRQSAGLDAGWATASEQIVTTGSVRFTAPVSTQQARGFYQVRIKP